MQQIIEKVNISKASLLLSANVNFDSVTVESGHPCFNCSFLLDENSAEIIDGLPELRLLIQDHLRRSFYMKQPFTTKNMDNT